MIRSNEEILAAACGTDLVGLANRPNGYCDLKQALRAMEMLREDIQNSIPKVLTINSKNLSPERLAKFKEEWYGMMMGPATSAPTEWITPKDSPNE